ncbi:MAG: RNA polymerase sigma-70 factor [Gemmatimonadaceae bacterium]|jgi:RNA polymerase sigma-70 factor (ECF subfamily)|nr:RNA polymerase sigma-70 factor [Gemmatimonadaceae bacterium]
MMTAHEPALDCYPEWTRRLRASDHAALEAVFDALHEPLVAWGRRLVGDAAQARDIVQVAFIRLWEQRDVLDPERSIRAWLFRTVRNEALTRLRDARNRDRSLETWDDAPHWRPPDPDALLEESELGRSLQAWMAELPERQREAIRLSRFEGLSHEEIAEAMDIAPRTVNNHIVRGLQTLRARFDASRSREQT